MAKIDTTYDVLDLLVNAPPGGNEMVDIDDEVVIPKRCSVCKCSPICSVLPTFIALSRIGICAGIEACPFFSQIKKTS